MSTTETTAITPDLWPDLTERDARVYQDEQIPYANHATHFSTYHHA